MSISEKPEYVTSFKSLLEDVRRQLLEAQTHFDIWKALWPTEEVVDILNRYRGFFLPTVDAHWRALFIKIVNATDNDPSAPSVYRLLGMVQKHPDLAPSVNFRAIHKRIRRLKDVLRRIKEVRNKRAAHRDTYVAEPLEPVLLNETSGLLEELQNIFNEIHGAHDGNEYVFQYRESIDVSALLDRLKDLDRP